MPEFLIDTQLPPKLASFLSDKGYNSKHTTDYKEGHVMQDYRIIEIAINEKRIIITKDNDFMDYYILHGYPPKILLIQLGNISNIDLFTIIENNLNKIISLFKRNKLVIVNKKQVIGY
jgi:predicted nuclease of predicted toxin-antitoxin system